MDEKLLKAVEEYEKRQRRASHPAGKFDNGGRWYPSEAEHQKCCNGVRSPSRNWPYSYMTHCRTAEHIAHLYGVDLKDLRHEINIRAKARKLAEQTEQAQPVA